MLLRQASTAVGAVLLALFFRGGRGRRPPAILLLSSLCGNAPPMLLLWPTGLATCKQETCCDVAIQEYSDIGRSLPSLDFTMQAWYVGSLTGSLALTIFVQDFVVCCCTFASVSAEHPHLLLVREIIGAASSQSLPGKRWEQCCL